MNKAYLTKLQQYIEYDILIVHLVTMLDADITQ